MDLEDRDGMSHWLGVAISLSFTIGLHRKDSFDSMTPRPFSNSIRRLWKCLWSVKSHSVNRYKIEADLYLLLE